MPSKRKRGNAYELRASCGFNARGKRIMKTRTWKPPYGMTEAQAEKEATRQAFLFEEEIRRGDIQAYVTEHVRGRESHRGHRRAGLCGPGSGFRRAVHRRRGRDALREYDTALPPLIVRDFLDCGQLAGDLFESLRAREAPENAP